MATLNIGIKYTGQINQAGGANTTFVVPAGQYFRGYISGVGGTGGNVVIVACPIIRVRQNNGAGAIIATGGSNGLSHGAPSSDNNPRTFTPSMYIELGAGTYFVEGVITGNLAFAGLTSTHVCGVLMANTQ